jgi:hypothetical protein
VSRLKKTVCLEEWPTQRHKTKNFKNTECSPAHWLESVILAIQETEIRRLSGQPEQKVWEIPSQPMGGHSGGAHLSSQLCREAQIEDHGPGQPNIK